MCMKEIGDKLAAVGSAAAEEEQVVALLISPPPRYEALVRALAVKEKIWRCWRQTSKGGAATGNRESAPQVDKPSKPFQRQVLLWARVGLVAGRRTRYQMVCALCFWIRLVSMSTLLYHTCAGKGREHTSYDFEEYLRKRAIKHETSVAHCPQQNGVAASMKSTLLESTRAMEYHAKLSKVFWAEAVKHCSIHPTPCYDCRVRQHALREVVCKSP